MRALSPAFFCALTFAATLSAEGPNIPTQEPVAADSGSSSPEAEIKVCVDVAAPVRFEILGGAERTAIQLFEGIGVHLRFTCERAPDASRREILMRLTDRTDPSVLNRALGFARPYARDGVRITIFYDRVEGLQRGRDITGVILGHTMTHELTHVLEAENVHTENGIMRSRWDEHDLDAMRTGELYFSEADVRAIHHNLSAFYRP